MRKSEEPFFRIDSKKCLLWFQLSKTSSSERKAADSVQCPSCTRLKCGLEHQARRTCPSKRQDSSSNAKLSYMSPQSQLKRRQNQKMEMDEN